MKKRFLLGMLAGIMMFGLMACGPEETEEVETSSKKATESQIEETKEDSASETEVNVESSETEENAENSETAESEEASEVVETLEVQEDDGIYSFNDAVMYDKDGIQVVANYFDSNTSTFHYTIHSTIDYRESAQVNVIPYTYNDLLIAEDQHGAWNRCSSTKIAGAMDQEVDVKIDLTKYNALAEAFGFDSEPLSHMVIAVNVDSIGSQWYSQQSDYAEIQTTNYKPHLIDKYFGELVGELEVAGDYSVENEDFRNLNLLHIANEATSVAFYGKVSIYADFDGQWLKIAVKGHDVISNVKWREGSYIESNIDFPVLIEEYALCVDGTRNGCADIFNGSNFGFNIMMGNDTIQLYAWDIQNFKQQKHVAEGQKLKFSFGEDEDSKAYWNLPVIEIGEY